MAHLVRYLGIALGAEYKKSNETSAKTSKAVEWFNKWGGLNASSLKGYNESNIISAIKSGYPVLGRGNSGKKRYLVFVSDGKEDMLGFMMVSLLHLKMENLTISSTVIGDGVAIKMATISVKPLILMQVPQSMIHLTNNQVKLQTINITLNIQS